MSGTEAAQPALADPTQDTPQSTSADDVIQQVRAEQALQDAQKRIAELESEAERLRKEYEGLKAESQGASSTTNQLRTQLSTLQSSFHNTSSELAVLKTRLEANDREKRELVDEVARHQEKSSHLSSDVHALRSQRAEAVQKVAQLDVEVHGLKLAAESSQFNEQRSIQALKNARAEILSLSKATAEVEERFGRYRAEKQAEQSSLQTEYDTIAARATASENTLQMLERSHLEQSRRLTEAHQNIQTLTTAAAERKASSSNELANLLDRNRVLEQEVAEARSTVRDRESELERQTNAQADVERTWDEKFKKEQRVRKEAEKRSEDLKVVVERLSIAQGEGGELSAAAALAANERGSGKSYTQFYTDYTIQESKLRAAENEVDRLTQLLDEISADIREKKPLLDEQAAEHAAAVDRANALASELSFALSARDKFEREAKSLKATAGSREDEAKALQGTADDLARQVQSLIREISIRDDPTLANVTMDGSSTVSEVGDIVTDHLVSFRSIRSLQEQNQKLLKLTRGLMAKLDSQEVRRATSDADEDNTGATLDQAAETITKLHAQLLEAQKKINEVTRERDTFSKLLAKGEGLRRSTQVNGSSDEGAAEHQRLVASLQEEISSIRTKAEQEVSEAKQDLRKKIEEAGQASVDKAKAEAQLKLLEGESPSVVRVWLTGVEQRTTLNDNAALQRQEATNLQTQLHQAQSSIQTANNERCTALEQVASKQAEADRLRNEAANLRAEKEQWRSTEARLQDDFNKVQSERSRLQQMIAGLNTVNTESENSRTAKTRNLEKQVEDLQREATSLREQLERAKEATRDAEKRSEDFDARLESATASVRAEKDAAESLVAARDTEIARLKTDLETTKTESDRRMKIGLSHQRRANENRDKLQEKETEAAEKQTRIETLEREIGEMKTKLTDSERGSQHKDATISRLQSELSSKQPAQAAAPAPDNAALAALQSERDMLQQRLAQAEAQLADLKATSTSAAQPATTLGASDNSGELQSQIATLTEERDKARKELSEQLEKYEENVAKVNRVNGNLNRSMTALRAEVNTRQERIQELEKEIEELKAQPAATGEATPASEGSIEQAKIDEAVKAAVQAKEADLKAEHAKALAAAGQPAAEGSSQSTDTAALDARKAELEASFETRVKEASATKLAELERERDTLRGELEELKQKVKVLERQLKNAEITRKTLERYKGEYEAQKKRMEEGETPTPAAAQPTADAAAPTLSAGATEFKPTATATTATTPAAAAAHPAASTSAAPTSPASSIPQKSAGAIRGAARGRVRVARGRGGARGVLETVNATMSANQAAAPAPAIGNKRPLTEEGEINETPASTSDGAQAGTGEKKLRVLKRPKPTPAPGDASGGDSAGAEGTNPGGEQGPQDSTQ